MLFNYNVSEYQYGYVSQLNGLPFHLTFIELYQFTIYMNFIDTGSCALFCTLNLHFHEDPCEVPPSGCSIRCSYSTASSHPVHLLLEISVETVSQHLKTLESLLCCSLFYGFLRKTDQNNEITKMNSSACVPIPVMYQFVCIIRA